MHHPLNNLSDQAHLLRQSKRAQIDELRALAEHLPKDDRLLIEQVLDGHMPISHLARMYQQPPRYLQRRAQSILKRLSNKYFRFVALQINTLPHEVRSTARHVILNGQSMRKTAQTSGLTLHRIRNHMNTVHATARLFT